MSSWEITTVDMKTSSKAHIGKLFVDRMSLDDFLGDVAGWLATAAPHTIFTANAHAVTLAESDPVFAETMGKADAVLCDGFGVYVASRLLGSSLPQRFTPTDWIERLGTVCRDSGASMFFLGARQGVAQKAARHLEAAVPGLRVHSHHGHFEKDDASSRAVVDVVNGSGADVLLVGFGMPLQEEWTVRYRQELRPRITLSVGGLFDHVGGELARGPRWLTQHGFEWLTRLLIEPRRLWRRYLIGLPEFGILVGRQWMTTRFNPRTESR